MSKHFSERADLSASLFSLLTSDDQNQESNINILVKGSRSAHMENVVEDIISWHDNRYQGNDWHAPEGNA